jgi:hypothetical protein
LFGFQVVMGDAVGREREEHQILADEIEPAATDLDVVIRLTHARDRFLSQLPGQHGNHAGMFGHAARPAGMEAVADAQCHGAPVVVCCE